MTININYGKYTLFDIEWWITENEIHRDRWHSELDCVVCVKGLCMFLKDNIGKEGFDLDEFIKNSYEIQELRGWLWERHSNTNIPLDECSKRHYHTFQPELYKIIDSYCEKYGFYKNID